MKRMTRRLWMLLLLLALLCPVLTVTASAENLPTWDEIKDLCDEIGLYCYNQAPTAAQNNVYLLTENTFKQIVPYDEDEDIFYVLVDISSAVNAYSIDHDGSHSFQNESDNIQVNERNVYAFRFDKTQSGQWSQASKVARLDCGHVSCGPELKIRCDGCAAEESYRFSESQGSYAWNGQYFVGTYDVNIEESLRSFLEKYPGHASDATALTVTVGKINSELKNISGNELTVTHTASTASFDGAADGKLYAPGETVTLPEAPAGFDPESSVFLGWKLASDGKLYTGTYTAANANMVFTSVAAPKTDMAGIAKVLVSCKNDQCAVQFGAYTLEAGEFTPAPLTGAVGSFTAADEVLRKYAQTFCQDNPGHPAASIAIGSNVGKVTYDEASGWGPLAGPGNIAQVSVDCSRYTISFDPGVDASGAAVQASNLPVLNQSSYLTGETVTEVDFSRLPAPRAAGLVFSHWGTQANLEYAADGSASFKMPGQNVVFTAVWLPDANGDGIEDGKEHYIKLKVQWVDENSPVRPGSVKVNVQDKQDGFVFETVELTAAGKWSYDFPVMHVSALDYVDMVQQTPDYYSSTCVSSTDGNTTTFTFTNTRLKTRADGSVVQQTGQLTWPVGVLAIAGVSMMAMGIWLVLERRKGKYER